MNNSSAMLTSLTTAAFLSLATVMTGPATGAEEGKPLVRINGQTLTSHDLDLAATEIGPQLSSVPEADRNRVLVEYLLENALLAKAASEAGLGDAEGFEDRLAYYKQRALRDAYFEKHVMSEVTDADAKELYDKQIGNVSGKEEIHARHILVESEADAKDIIERLNRGAEFSELAKEESKGPSGENGGDLGYFSRGQMVPTFEKAAFELDKGQVSEPVKTQFGWHVIMLEDRRQQQAPEFAELKDRIIASLIARKAKEVIDGLRSSAEVEFLDKELEEAVTSAPRGSFAQ